MKNHRFISELMAGLIIACLLIGQEQTLAAAFTTTTTSGYQPKSTFISVEKTAPMPFTSLGAKWRQLQPPGTSAELFVRFEGYKGWSDWQELHGDIDGLGESDTENPVAFIASGLTTKMQYKVVLQSADPKFTPVIENIEFTYINAHDSVVSSENLVAAIGPESAGLIAASNAAKTTADGAKIISRSEWGADESLRLWQEDRPKPQLVSVDDEYLKKFAGELKIKNKVKTDSKGKDLTWPLEYPEKVSKFVIHHTATTKNLDDPKKAIRDIYYWHAITRGWGDIGYNFIIDTKGNVYEGRFGGDGVVGAHAGKSNVGSIGIAVLGNYEENEVPESVVSSIARLISVKAKKWGIDPAGSSTFRGEKLPNIIGHRDVMSTTCPGGKLYDQLPAIRAMARGSFKPELIDSRRTVAQKQHDFSITKSPDFLQFDPGSEQEFTISIKNTGKVNWGSATNLIVMNDGNAQKYLQASAAIQSDNIGTIIKPGVAGSFKIKMKSTYNGGFGTIDIYPFVDGKTRVEKYLRIPLQVDSPRYDYEFVKFSIDKPYLKKGEKATARLQIKNTGNVIWKNDGMNSLLIGTQNPQDHLAKILARPGTRLAAMIENVVRPGETANFAINIKAPAESGPYREYFAPVIEGITWLAFKGNYLDIFVYEQQYLAKYFAVSGGLTALPGETKKLTVEFQNAGGVVWNKSGTDALVLDVASDSNVITKVVGLEQDQVLPGQTAKVNIVITAPAKEGAYNLQITPKLGSKQLLSKPQSFALRVSKQASSVEAAANDAAAENGDTNMIRIDLGFRGNPVISANGAFKLVDGEVISEFAKNEKVTVSYEQGNYMIKSDKSSVTLTEAPRFEAVDSAVLRIDNYEHRPDWNKDLNDNEYRGMLEVQWYDNTLHVINELPIEDYLKGLAEISATDPVSKIRAVIILARSYARFYTSIAEKFPGAPFNLTDDPERSQKYLGYGFEKRSPTGVKAVKDTAGIVVTYNKKIIKTPYFSSDDGRTRSAEEVWGWKDTPYLVSVDDPGCKGKAMAGHGVGMSGCGALYYANQGKTYTEIIKYYFKGVEVEKK